MAFYAEFVLENLVHPTIFFSIKRNQIFFVFYDGKLQIIKKCFFMFNCSWGSQGRILKWFAIPFSSGPGFVRNQS